MAMKGLTCMCGSCNFSVRIEILDWPFFLYDNFILYTLLSVLANSGRVNLGKATVAAARAAPPSPTSACWVFSCFRNPPNLTWTTTGSLTCVRDHSYVCVCTRGLATPTTSQHDIFDSEKRSYLFLCSCAPDRTGF